jgi:hypothetical protein
MRLLLVPLAVAAFLLAAPQAQAFTCGPTASNAVGSFDVSGQLWTVLLATPLGLSP